MRFTIELVRTVEGGHDQVLYRTAVDEISPKRAKVKADQLLSAWQARGATLARTVNPHGEELYVKKTR